jgi:hypothetical protein
MRNEGENNTGGLRENGEPLDGNNDFTLGVESQN